MSAAERAVVASRAVGRWAASIPFTWVIVGVAIVVGVLQLVFHASLYRLFDPAFSFSFDSVVGQHHWFAAITSVLFAARALHILIVVPIILIMLGAAERLMGTWRTAVSYVVVAVLGGGLGLALQGVGLWLGIVVAEQVRSYATIDPITPIVGTIMAASAFAGPLLRRRIRVLGFTVLLMLVLYSGLPVDLYRLLAAVVGVAFGAALWRVRARRRPGGRAGEPTRYRSTHREQRSLLAALVAITAVGPVITVVAPNGFGPLQPLGLLFRDTLSNSAALAAQCAAAAYGDDCSDAHAAARLDGLGPVLVTVLPLVVLLIAALGILRGRRVALWLAVAVNLFLTVLGVAYYGVIPALGTGSFFDFSNGTFDQASVSVFVSVLVPLLIAALLVGSLRIFPVDSTFGATPRFFIIIASALVGIAAVYLVVAYALRDQFAPAVNLADLLYDLPERFMPVGFLSLERVDVFPNGGPAQFVYEWVGPLFWFVVAVTAVLSVSRHRLGQAGGEAGRIRTLLHQGATGSLSWITTWRGHHYWFSPDQGSAIAYRVVNGVAIATGEPLGGERLGAPTARDARSETIAQFAAFCTRHGWTPVFYVVSAELAPVFAGLHWSMMKIAEEARIDLAAFSLEGKKMQDVRTAINKATKLGIRAEFTSFSRLTLGQAAQVREISEAWVADKQLPEMGFTLGGVDELTDPEVRLVLAVDADERVLGVTSWLPTFENDTVVGYTLDFMRRRPGAINGVMEFTIGESILAAKREGLRFVSLSAAPLAHTEDGGAAAGEGAAREGGARAALLDVLGRALEPVYGFQSLLAFKQKFRPQNVPLYLAYADPLTLPAVGVALARAYVPTLSARQAIALLASRGS
ncbi:bifunctional lysylphosphatidylglycerol flippase/synthetase MprF [Subtercola sp. YIM 133946]|uniref:bifunctional lysylphosphatidylglycerol flippase/synthetase MprF n=1 Tax=Subtercola sp. YIM 133946 TaxID=3118909 RepID=UPI002F924634